MSLLWSILRLRCPRCRQGAVYSGLLAMHRACPHCGLPLVREPGFYMGAMYFSYTLATLAALPIVLWMFFQRIAPHWSALAGGCVIAVLSPFIVRYSRILWLYFDQRFDPK